MPLSAIISVLAEAASASRPAVPGAGGLVAYVVCARRKREEIGGWLMLFYWQLYAGLMMSGVFLAMNIESYVPENFADNGQFVLFLASALPGIILMTLQCAAATLLLIVREWTVLKLLRWLVAASLAAGVAAAAIDAAHFPENAMLSYLTISSSCIWLAYLFLSRRVKHVFRLHDWDKAVLSFYPPKQLSIT